jgi:putative ABC transport system permease protein
MLPLITIKQFFNDLRRQKLRSLLTMFGIFWGSCSIVLLMAFGQGLTEAQMTSMKGMGDNIVIFWPGITSIEYQGFSKGRSIRPTEQDAELLKATGPAIGTISPEFRKWNVPVRYNRNTTLRPVIGIWPEFGGMRNLIPQEGSRFINELDQKERRRVVFIGNILKTDLFGAAQAVGKRILIDGMPFTVIGVMKEKDQNSSYGGRDSRLAFIPTSTFTSMYSRRYVDDIVLQPAEGYKTSDARQDVFNILGSKYRFDPTDKEALMIWDTARAFEFLRKFFLAFKWFLVGIGISTLITGGIGVSNIMNVVLEERTKEIGIKMALGARKGFVLFQFLTETLMITAVGGFLGFIFAWLIILVVPAAGLESIIGHPRVDLLTGMLVTILLGLVGLAAGFFPARRAANLQPVQALKLF